MNRHRRPAPRPGCRPTGWAIATALATLATIAPAAGAVTPAVIPAVTPVSDCHLVVEHAAGSLDRRARVGEVDRHAVPALRRVVNHGPHDIRATFDGLGPRVLQRGQSEPARGRLDTPVTLLSTECLPARAASPSTGTATPVHPPQPGSDRLGPVHPAATGEHA